jgi:hypothetical protein
MPRTIIYKRDVEEHDDAVEAGAPAQPTLAGAKIPATAAAKKKAATDALADGYVEKLLKYVPAEVIAFFAPIASLVEKQTALLVASGIVGLVATPLYIKLYSRNLRRRSKGTQPPPIYNYALSMAAFVVWALATSKLGGLLHMSSTAIAFMLGVAVFVIPLADKLISERNS